MCTSCAGLARPLPCLCLCAQAARASERMPRVNAVSLSDIQNGLYEPGCMGLRGKPSPSATHPSRQRTALCCAGTRVFLFLGLMLSFGTIVAAVWILAGDYVPSHQHIYGGVAVLLQNILIFVRCVGLSRAPRQRPQLNGLQVWARRQQPLVAYRHRIISLHRRARVQCKESVILELLRA